MITQFKEKIWEECSKEEYDKHAGLFEFNYRMVPHYIGTSGGILSHIKFSNREPDYYTYEKCAGEKEVICVTSDDVETLQKFGLL